MILNHAVGHELLLAPHCYRFVEHPAIPGLPYAQQGRRGTVYQVVADAEPWALKVFLPRFREPALVGQSDRIAPFAAELPGLRAARRTVLTPRRHPDLLRDWPDLTYSVLMPWIDGPTWAELVAEQRDLTPGECRAIADTLVHTLLRMEEQGIAHGDLSGSNLVITALADQANRRDAAAIEFVDLEELFAPGLERPEVLSCGSPGYAHQAARAGLWSRDADRFAGAVLLAEMLCWGDKAVRGAAWGESYFARDEMHQETVRYQTLVKALRERTGARVAELFERAWRSDLLRECPTFGDWAVALSEGAGSVGPRPLSRGAVAEVPARAGGDEELAELLLQGVTLLDSGNRAAAAELFREVARRRPDYRQGGHSVAELLARATPGPPAVPQRRKGLRPAMLATVAVVAPLVIAWLSLRPHLPSGPTRPVSEKPGAPSHSEEPVRALPVQQPAASTAPGDEGRQSSPPDTTQAPPPQSQAVQEPAKLPEPPVNKQQAPVEKPPPAPVKEPQPLASEKPQAPPPEKPPSPPAETPQQAPAANTPAHTEVWSTTQPRDVRRYRVLIRGKELPGNTPPIVISQTVMVPLGASTQMLGLEVVAEMESKIYTIKSGSVTMKFVIDSREAAVNDRAITLSPAPRFENGLTYLPAAFAAHFGTTLRWNEERQLLSIE